MACLYEHQEVTYDEALPQRFKDIAQAYPGLRSIYGAGEVGLTDDIKRDKFDEKTDQTSLTDLSKRDRFRVSLRELPYGLETLNTIPSPSAGSPQTVNFGLTLQGWNQKTWCLEVEAQHVLYLGPLQAANAVASATNVSGVWCWEHQLNTAETHNADFALKRGQSTLAVAEFKVTKTSKLLETIWGDGAGGQSQTVDLNRRSSNMRKLLGQLYGYALDAQAPMAMLMGVDGFLLWDVSFGARGIVEMCMHEKVYIFDTLFKDDLRAYCEANGLGCAEASLSSLADAAMVRAGHMHPADGA